MQILKEAQTTYQTSLYFGLLLKNEIVQQIKAKAQRRHSQPIPKPPTAPTQFMVCPPTSKAIPNVKKPHDSSAQGLAYEAHTLVSVWKSIAATAIAKGINKPEYPK